MRLAADAGDKLIPPLFVVRERSEAPADLPEGACLVILREGQEATFQLGSSPVQALKLGGSVEIGALCLELAPSAEPEFPDTIHGVRGSLDPELYLIESLVGEAKFLANLAKAGSEGLTIGRSHEGVDLRLEDTAISRLHARIFQRDGVCWIEDLQSTHGVWIHGQRVDGKRELADRDRIRVGSTTLEYRCLRDAVRRSGGLHGAASAPVEPAAPQIPAQIPSEAVALVLRRPASLELAAAIIAVGVLLSLALRLAIA